MSSLADHEDDEPKTVSVPVVQCSDPSQTCPAEDCQHRLESTVLRFDEPLKQRTGRSAKNLVSYHNKESKQVVIIRTAPTSNATLDKCWQNQIDNVADVPSTWLQIPMNCSLQVL